MDLKSVLKENSDGLYGNGANDWIGVRFDYATTLLILMFGYPGSVVINLKYGSYKFEFISLKVNV